MAKLNVAVPKRKAKPHLRLTNGCATQMVSPTNSELQEWCSHGKAALSAEPHTQSSHFPDEDVTSQQNAVKSGGTQSGKSAANL